MIKCLYGFAVSVGAFISHCWYDSGMRWHMYILDDIWWHFFHKKCISQILEQACFPFFYDCTKLHDVQIRYQRIIKKVLRQWYMLTPSTISLRQTKMFFWNMNFLYVYSLITCNLIRRNTCTINTELLTS